MWQLIRNLILSGILSLISWLLDLYNFFFFARWTLRTYLVLVLITWSFAIFIIFFVILPFFYPPFKAETASQMNQELTQLAADWGYDLVASVYRGNFYSGNAFLLIKSMLTLNLKLQVFNHEFGYTTKFLATETSPLINHYFKLSPDLPPHLKSKLVELLLNFSKHLKLLLECTEKRSLEPEDVRLFWHLACTVYIEFTYIKTLVMVIEELSVKQSCYCDHAAYLGLKNFINDFSSFMKSIPHVQKP